MYLALLPLEHSCHCAHQVGGCLPRELHYARLTDLPGRCIEPCVHERKVVVQTTHAHILDVDWVHCKLPHRLKRLRVVIIDRIMGSIILRPPPATSINISTETTIATATDDTINDLGSHKGLLKNLHED